MIYQLESVKTKTEALPTINKALLQVRHIQARLQKRTKLNPFGNRLVWSPSTPSSLLQPISRWVE